MIGAFCSGSVASASFIVSSTLVTVAAATATMATFTKRETSSEMALSTVLYISARRAGPSPGGGVAPRVSTLPECRYRLCGITTAPSRDTAMYAAPVSGTRGMSSPDRMPPKDSCASTISTMKQTLITPTITPITISSLRALSTRKSIVLTPVMSTPTHSGVPNSSISANAVPMTSGMSEHTMAASVMSHSPMRTGLGYSSRHTRARCMPVPSARRTVSTWMSSPASVAHSSTHNRE
mmetsp:Transcript_32774/g.82214  ORF Transcript_32774/g.82214 Transcript_32774/m.82214 type:complete len:237 (+) Transcript_32774:956-1666(+)